MAVCFAAAYVAVCITSYIPLLGCIVQINCRRVCVCAVWCGKSHLHTTTLMMVIIICWIGCHLNRFTFAPISSHIPNTGLTQLRHMFIAVPANACTFPKRLMALASTEICIADIMWRAKQFSFLFSTFSNGSTLPYVRHTVYDVPKSTLLTKIRIRNEWHISTKRANAHNEICSQFSTKMLETITMTLSLSLYTVLLTHVEANSTLKYTANA